MNRFLRLSLLFTVAALIGCASHGAAPPDRVEFNQIVDITIDNDSVSLNLNIQAIKLLNYTEDRIANPRGVVFSFPHTQIDSLRGLYTPPENEVIRYIRADAHAVNESPVATIYISLKANTLYEVTRDAGRMQVAFYLQPAISHKIAPYQKPAEAKPEFQKNQKLLPTATKLLKVNIESHKGALAVDVVTDGTITKYNAFSIDNPARIVFDFYNIKSPHLSEQKFRVHSKAARQIRYFGHPDKLRLVIDTQSAYLSKYSSTPTDTGIMIKVGNLQE